MRRRKFVLQAGAGIVGLLFCPLPPAGRRSAARRAIPAPTRAALCASEGELESPLLLVVQEVPGTPVWLDLPGARIHRLGAHSFLHPMPHLQEHTRVVAIVDAANALLIVEAVRWRSGRLLYEGADCAAAWQRTGIRGAPPGSFLAAGRQLVAASL
ncbi:MAG TPA: hypothetical protein VLX90_19615 [Steroidobacteraceae bacterium]|nr:hypothetical protein [Steroidobacteraceae bacterium]